MPNLVQEAYVAAPLSASGLVKTGQGIVASIFVSSGTAVTVKVWDNTSAAGTVILETTAAITPPLNIPLQAAFSTGCFVTLAGTAPTVSVMYQ
jgi:hypothetical protein